MSNRVSRHHRKPSQGAFIFPQDLPPLQNLAADSGGDKAGASTFAQPQQEVLVSYPPAPTAPPVKDAGDSKPSNLAIAS